MAESQRTEDRCLDRQLGSEATSPNPVARIRTTPAPILWSEACRFFLHDETDTTTGVQLPGFELPCVAPQMMAVYELLRPCASDDFNGTFKRSDSARCKSMTLLMAGVIALAHMCRDHCHESPSLHRPAEDDDDGPCPNGNIFGIMCYCVRGSFTRRICDTANRAPHLVVMSSQRTHLSSCVTLRDGSVHVSDPLLRVAETGVYRAGSRGVDPSFLRTLTHGIAQERLMLLCRDQAIRNGALDQIFAQCRPFLTSHYDDA
ncbi:hypothetical protein QQX98_002533 [Neonectria punicea]|uniref:Uncharacterized protein n=1 Tax=Neonectria punicea TaxID=979145 RepID=A0ABR1HIG3_9HYPO